MSGATISRIPPDSPLRPLASVIVKGKSEPVDVFTFDADAEVRDLTAQAIAAFAGRRWDEAQRLCEALLAKRAGDAVAKRYLDRITVLRSEPPGDDWTPAEALDKM